ncbi:MAG: diguanylate cyclase [Candidatus Omnitrophota bacterium]
MTIFVLMAFIANGFVPFSYAQTLALPAPGTMVSRTPAYVPLMLKGLKVHPENPLLFDFIVDTGNSGLGTETSRATSLRLIKYFLAALTIKENDLWVNLSPYQKDRMIVDELGKTELGRDMLAQDYVLKQLTASMIYPENDLGKKFWQRVYAKAQDQFGTTDIPVDTFNKVWITADKAKVLERNNVAYVVGGHLKVMLESDYEAMSHQKGRAKSLALAGDKAQEHASTDGGHGGPLQDDQRGSVSPATLPSNKTPDFAKDIIREIILPEIEKEVNEGANFANLRQIFYSMILATWYKKALKGAFLNQVYANMGKVGGVISDDLQAKERIYAQYLDAYKKGVFNYIKEESVGGAHEPPLLVNASPERQGQVSKGASDEVVTRKYFSGGIARNLDLAQNMEVVKDSPLNNVGVVLGELLFVDVRMDQAGRAVAETNPVDASMKSDVKEYARLAYASGYAPFKTYGSISELMSALLISWSDRDEKVNALKFVRIREKQLATRESALKLLAEIKNQIESFMGDDINPRLPVFIASSRMSLGILAHDENLRHEFGLLLGVGHWPEGAGFSKIAEWQAEHWKGVLANDKLTGLSKDRSNLFKWLGVILGKNARLSPEDSVIIAVSDNDFFSSVNNVFGHLMGDEVLKGAVNVFQRSLRPDDYVLRYGGEEFVLVFSGPQQHGAGVVMKRVRDNMLALVKNAPTGSMLSKLQDKQFVLGQLSKVPKDEKLYRTLLFQIMLQNPGVSVEQLDEAYGGDTDRLINAWLVNDEHVFAGWVVSMSAGVSFLSPLRREEIQLLDYEKTVGDMVKIADELLTQQAKKTRNSVVVAQEPVAPVKVDHAKDVLGGIDLNAQNMGLNIEKSESGIAMTFDPAVISRFKVGNFTGIVPVILKVTPIRSLSEIL